MTSQRLPDVSLRPARQARGALPRLDTTSLRDRARNAIRASIVSGELGAGTICPVARLASELGVSATPIREALFDLAGSGLLEIVRNRGFRVPVLSERDLDEICDLRMLLERPAVVRVAANPPVGQLGALRTLTEEMESQATAGDFLGFLAEDRRFHKGLLSLCGNESLVALVMSLRDRTRLYGVPELAGSARLVESARMHSALLRAVEAGDVAEADRVSVRHLRDTRGILAGRADPPVPPIAVEAESPARPHRSAPAPDRRFRRPPRVVASGGTDAAPTA